MKFQFNFKSLIIFISLFIIEIIIAKTYGFLRHTIGDYLVVILLYYFVKSFLKVSPKKLAISILLFSFTVEILQYFKLVELLGLQDNKLASIIIGSTFSYGDLVAYTLGVVTVYYIEVCNQNKFKKNNLKFKQWKY